ncbi:hypothetical protein [Pararobbsia alpina]|uniref:hypothetical protein n=1 Tax=Pararobbsia alpina TaxID=621374 RepID=UPI0039A578DE
MALNESNARRKQLIAMKERTLQMILQRINEAAARGRFDGVVVGTAAIIPARGFHNRGTDATDPRPID